MPTCANTYAVRPEQSNEFGPEAANTYGLPVWAAARATTQAPRPVPPGMFEKANDVARYPLPADRTAATGATGAATVIFVAGEVAGVRPREPPKVSRYVCDPVGFTVNVAAPLPDRRCVSTACQLLPCWTCSVTNWARTRTAAP